MKKPDYLKPIFSTIPKIMTGYHQWILWKAIEKEGKFTKVPVDPKTFRSAKSNDRTTWASFEAACQALDKSNGRCDGIGFVLTENDPFVGFDFDHCVDREAEKDSVVQPFASYIESIDSYTEYSPSGEGIRIIAMGKLPSGHSCRKGDRVEVYSTGRYLTITGAALDGKSEIRDATQEANQFYNHIFNNCSVESPKETPQVQPGAIDLKFLSNQKIRKLWDGDTSDYPSASEADLALCSLLSKYAKNTRQIDELFRKSALYRDKWDKKHSSNGQTYGEMTVEKALNKRIEPAQNLSGLIKDYVDTVEGVFTNRDLYEDLAFKSTEDRNNARAALSNLAKVGVIEREKRRAGMWRKVEKELKVMNLLDAEVENVKLTLPLGLHGLVNFHPGNIILVAGDVDAGKTGFMLNIVRDNVENFKIRYFSSEMGPQEIKSRIMLFDDFPPLDHPNMQFYERSGNFQDVIQPGEKNLNIIDYLEIVENFFEIGKYVKDIHDSLKGAIAIIAVQKRDQFSDNPIGGVRGLEKPRLAVSLKKGGTAKILKAKNWKTSINPNNLIRKYKLAQGWRFAPQGSWEEDND
jgi:hypothetical protein